MLTILNLFLSLSLILLQPLSASAQDPPLPERASVRFYNTNACCGGYLGYGNLLPGQCRLLNAVRDGFSMEVFGVWGDQSVYPPMGYGYGVMWRGSGACERKAFEIRRPGCVEVRVPGGVNSYSWERDSYVVPRGRLAAPEPVVPNMVNASSLEESGGDGGKEGCRGPDFYHYLDQVSGRPMRVLLHGSVKLGMHAIGLHENGDFEGLNRLVEKQGRGL